MALNHFAMRYDDDCDGISLYVVLTISDDVGTSLHCGVSCECDDGAISCVLLMFYLEIEHRNKNSERERKKREILKKKKHSLIECRKSGWVQ